jgi:CheY-like chemotaxis protein
VARRLGGDRATGPMSRHIEIEWLVHMPGRTDLDILRAIKSDPNLTRTRVVLLTALAQESDIRAGLVAGADAYLTNPFSPADLLSRLDEALKL